MMSLLDSNIIDESFDKGVHLIQSYGWLVVFTAVALYFAYPFIEVIENYLSLSLILPLSFVFGL